MGAENQQAIRLEPNVQAKSGQFPRSLDSARTIPVIARELLGLWAMGIYVIDPVASFFY